MTLFQADDIFARVQEARLTEILLLLIAVMVFLILRALRHGPDFSLDFSADTAFVGRKILYLLTLMAMGAVAAVLIWLLAITTGVWSG